MRIRTRRESSARTPRAASVKRVTRVGRRVLTERSDDGAVARQSGYVSEVFASVQGEGIYVGERQVFVRMAGCSATCSWCDTIGSRARRPTCVVYGAEKRTLDNPVRVDQIVVEVLALIEQNGPIRTVSLTGGEPLEQAEFVGGIAAALKRHRCRVYLDTNGLETEGIGKVIRHVDVVAMDIKLPSATGKVNWDVHRAFLRALRRGTVFVKIVVDHSTPIEELEEAVQLVAAYDKGAPLVLQPESATLLKGAHGAAAKRRLLHILDRTQRRALESLDDVRVIPQCHKLLKVR